MISHINWSRIEIMSYNKLFWIWYRVFINIKWTNTDHHSSLNVFGSTQCQVIMFSISHDSKLLVVWCIFIKYMIDVYNRDSIIWLITRFIEIVESASQNVTEASDAIFISRGAGGPGREILQPPSVCLSVCPSVTFSFRTVTQKRIAVFSRNFAGTCTKSWGCAV